MQVKVRLFATLRNNREKEMMMDLAEGITVRHIVERLSIPEKEAAIILINGRGARLDQALADNDTLSIFPPVGGG